MRRIGLFGGTFDPPTYLHLMTVERAREEFDLDEVVFIPVHEMYNFKGKTPAARATQRYEMLQKATEDNSSFTVSTIELDKLTQSNTKDTVKEYKQLAEEKEEIQLFLICGSDLLAGMKNWVYPGEIFANADIICVQRNGDNIYSDIILENECLVKYKRQIHIIYENVVNNISSTAVRNLVKNGMSIKYLTPNAVIEYIEQNKLYK